jgi:DNA repair exonuclease SbcCD nuclease subunit
VKGTKNHDLDQLDNFTFLEADHDIDFKIVNHVMAETYRQKKILYIPEEYMEDPTTYYAEYLSPDTPYDLCFIHGTFRHIEKVGKEIISEKPISTAPIFSYTQFKDIVTGPVLCGHIHIASSYKHKIYYTGSFARWKYGESKDKGYMTYTLEDDGTYTVKFVKNKYAEQYITVDVSSLTTTEDLPTMIRDILDRKHAEHIEHLRINLDHKLLEDHHIEDTVLKGFFDESDQEHVKLVVSRTTSPQPTVDTVVAQQYDYILQNTYGTDVSGMSLTLARYLKEHDNIVITKDVIEEILSSV